MFISYINRWCLQNIACLSTNRYRYSYGCIWAGLWAGSISNQFSWLLFQVLPLPRGALKFIWTPYSCDIIFKLFSLTYRPRIVYKVELPVFSILIIAKCLCGTLQLLPISVFSRVVMVGFKLPVGVVSTSVWLLVAFLSHVHCLWSSPSKIFTIICQNKMST